MIALFVILIVISLWGVKYAPSGHDDYMSREQTTAIKGIFAIIILFSHLRGYLIPEQMDPYYKYYNFALDFIGQSMVVMFLFYSGYGIMEALKRNREKYTATFFKHRTFKVWLMFAIALVMFVLLNLILGREYPMRNYLLCWTGYESIGNSNWFMFDIIVLYLLTHIALLVANELKLNLKWVTAGVTLLTMLLIVAVYVLEKGSWWYDTVLGYPLGMLFSLYKPSLKRFTRWGGVAALISLLLFIALHKHLPETDRITHAILYNVVLIATPIAFTAFIVSFTMKFKLNNRVIQWLGVNAFAIYILQRLAMIICTHFGWNGNGLLFSAIVIPMTLIIVMIYNAITDRALKLIK